ncbi:hypothetical protein CKA32_000672 [Geitlerinema sp. FC II]|nr:hypothetical protein CKA32_000672 [Geitlerinema sp. FC II]
MPAVFVSIPRRDFWVFQHASRRFTPSNLSFQSLEGIFGFFN